MITIYIYCSLQAEGGDWGIIDDIWSVMRPPDDWKLLLFFSKSGRFEKIW